MSEVLQLKTSKSKYDELLNSLNRKLNELQTIESELQTKRSRVESAIKGDQQAKLLRAIDNYRVQVGKQREKVQKQVQMIKDFLKKMEDTSSSVNTELDDEFARAQSIFK